MKWLFVIAGLVLLAAMLSGTPSKPSGNPLDPRVVELAERHAEQQAVQSRQMAELQKQWQTERTDLNEPRNRLEVERREIALQRQREPIIAQSIQQLGMLALCLVPLVVCALLLLRKGNEPADWNAIAETLVSDLMSAKPTLLAPALPAPSSDDNPAGHLAEARE